MSGTIGVRIRILARPVDEHTIEVAGMPVFYRSAPVRGHVPAPLYLHGIPTSSDDWLELVERTGGIAPDLIGFGRSGKAGHLEYSADTAAGFVEAVLRHAGIDRVTIVAHDWGAACAALLAARRPDRVARIAVCNPLPLLSGLEQRRLVHMLRKPGLGELIMGSMPRYLFSRALRGGGFPEARVGGVWGTFDQGTQRATLRLYRSLGSHAAEPPPLAPALVILGEQDPWLPPASEDRWPDAELVRIADAGHWPWLQSAEALERITAFVLG
jgi:pimeloyl-ACP methyl ester carboxylesterase